FDHSRAVPDPPPDDAAALVLAVGIEVALLEQLLGQPKGIPCAAPLDDELTCGKDTWAGDDALVDRACDLRPDEAPAAPNRREACLEEAATVAHGPEPAVGIRVQEEVLPAGAVGPPEVEVGVDQSRHQGQVAEVDLFGAVGHGGVVALEPRDPIALDDEGQGVDEAPCRDVEHLSCAQQLHSVRSRLSHSSTWSDTSG